MEDAAKIAALLVDDEPANLLALEGLLEGMDLRLVRASSGEEALKRLLEEDFALILLDVFMPGMDGFEVASLIRQRERCRRTPILFVTAIGKHDVHVFRGYSLGAVDYIIKPIVPEVLRSKVAVFVDLARRSDEVRRQSEEIRRGLEDQLRQAQKMEAVGRLAAGVAHDFRNMMTAVVGYASMAERGMDPADPLRGDVAEIVHIAQRACELTRQLSGFARRLPEAIRTLNPNDTLDCVERLLRRLLGSQVALEVRRCPDVRRVQADPIQIEQVILNLAINALDAMPAGGRVTIESSNVVLDEAACRDRADALPGAYAALSVRDTGTGMDAVTRARLFEPFFTTKAEGRGTGLGLSTALAIVRKYGGHMTVESALGRGSTFRVFLPAGDPPPRSEEPAVASLGAVLVVEDDDAVRNVMRQTLLQRGYRVLEAPDEREAISTCARERGAIRLLVVDSVSSVLSREEVAESLLRLQPEARVLFVSAGRRPVVDRGSDAHVLMKPFEPDELVAKVDAILAGAPGQDAGPVAPEWGANA